MTITYVYALIDPRLDTLAIRYVGKSVDPARRAEDHRACPGRTGHNPHKDNWIRQLQSSGTNPSIQVLQECTGDASWYEIEWIALCRAQGEPLTNLSKGGTGGWPLSPEQRSALGTSNILKFNATSTQEIRSEMARRGAATKIANGWKPFGFYSREERVEKGRLVGASWQKLTPEQRSERARRQMAMRTPEARSAAAHKAWATKRRKQQEAQDG